MKSLPIFCFRWQSLIPATVAEQLTLHRAINNNLRVVVNTVFSLISCKPHYRIPMRAIHLNTSEAIYWKRLCSYMLTSNHSPHSRKFYFLLGNNHVACRPHCRRWRYPPFLQFPVMCIDIGASLFCFRSHNGRRITYHQSLHTLQLRLVSEPAAWNGSRQNQKTLHIPLYNGETSSESLHVTWKDRIY